ncbi:MAG: metallophosphoesterase [Paracoccus sp. (in: a-proteobacteria)]|uniref:metallophosphoesterase family protein n=1 Tax=Paracoccus sp. TaxID=267 RepID=UPI0026DFCB2A|nr:metallophosphoesterase [Paracoccus sp. (in: a-proteobacteria)]MDO5631672.1 metallophosphoesterase [Paracoccus sp. (in: a-proteobacteria)]
MTRLVLLSDLHFGMHRVDLVPALLAQVNEAQPDLIVVAGDVTHRGRSAQFEQARRFLDRLAAPLIVVPGNHDVPLYRLISRLARPYRNWRRYMGGDLSPLCDAGRVRAIGVNSVDPLAWQRGQVTVAACERAIAALSPDLTNIVVLHHPLEQLPQVDKQLAHGAAQMLAALERAGAQIAISGHLHIWQAAAFAGRPLLQVQAGTALCDRPGDRQNEFAILDLKGERLTITRRISPMTGPARFTETVIECFDRRGGLWRRDQAIATFGG